MNDTFGSCPRAQIPAETPRLDMAVSGSRPSSPIDEGSASYKPDEGPCAYVEDDGSRCSSVAYPHRCDHSRGGCHEYRPVPPDSSVTEATKPAESFGYSTDEEMFYGDCPTREEALAEAIRENPDAWRIWTAKRVPLDLVQCFPPVDHLLDMIRDNSADVTCLDVLDCVEPSAEQRLDDALRAAFGAWLKAEGFDKYWTADDDQEHRVKPDPDEEPDA